MKPVYLDYAAATPMDAEVLATMMPYFTEKFYNPSAVYLLAQQVAADIADARKTVAHHLGVRPVELVFTAGGTEANNLVIDGIMRAYPSANVITSAIEHDSVLQPASRYSHNIAPVTPEGLVDVDALVQLVDDDTVLISVMYANNEIGTVQPIREIARQVALIRKDRQDRGVRLPLYVHTDAAQAVNYLDIHADRLGVDLMTMNGGKIYGPKQSGALYVKAGIQLEPIIRGGGQEQNVRSGTENTAAIIGFARALESTQQLRHAEAGRLQDLQRYFMGQLRRCIQNVTFNGSLRQRLPNNVHLTIAGQDNERLIMALDEAGIQAAAGSACSASDEAASHVLLAIGLDEAAARSSLRFTMGRATTKSDIDRAVKALQDIIGTESARV